MSLLHKWVCWHSVRFLVVFFLTAHEKWIASDFFFFLATSYATAITDAFFGHSPANRFFYMCHYTFRSTTQQYWKRLCQNQGLFARVIVYVIFLGASITKTSSQTQILIYACRKKKKKNYSAGLRPASYVFSLHLLNTLPKETIVNWSRHLFIVSRSERSALFRTQCSRSSAFSRRIDRSVYECFHRNVRLAIEQGLVVLGLVAKAQQARLVAGSFVVAAQCLASWAQHCGCVIRHHVHNGPVWAPLLA